MTRTHTRERLAILFPGQGSQTADMRDAVARHRPDLLEAVEQLVGEDPFARAEEQTRFAQPAIYCAGLAAWEACGRPEADALSGHSLGEIAALVTAGALSDDDGLRAVVARAEEMQRAAEQGRPGGMLAVRAGDEDVKEIAERHEVTVANVNEARQVVLSGELTSLDRAAEELEQAQIKAKPLPVGGAFHSPSMAAACEPFAAVLEEIEFRPTQTPVLCGATAAPFEDPRRQLVEAITRPVRWLEVMRAMQADGLRRFLEPGPGRVLAGMVRRSLDDVEALTGRDFEPAEATHA